MKNDYQHMMAQISLRKAARDAIAAQLDAGMPRRRRRPVRVLLAAACMGVLLAGTAAAAGIHIQIQRQLANGAEFTYESKDGRASSGGTSGESPIVLRSGRFYLVLDGMETDITGQFSDTEYYLYCAENEDGSWEDIVIGGTEAAYGYAIYVYDADGTYLGNQGWGTYEDTLAPTPWGEAYKGEYFDHYEPKL